MNEDDDACDVQSWLLVTEEQQERVMRVPFVIMMDHMMITSFAVVLLVECNVLCFNLCHWRQKNRNN